MKDNRGNSPSGFWSHEDGERLVIAGMIVTARAQIRHVEHPGVRIHHFAGNVRLGTHQGKNAVGEMVTDYNKRIVFLNSTRTYSEFSVC